MLLRLSSVTPRPIDWLWPNRLALGKLALCDGDPGLGKSLMTLDLSARLTTGRPFPDDAPSPGPANAILLNAEDGIDDTVVPRLRALGADLDRIFTFFPESNHAAAISIPSRLDLLDDLLVRTSARLVVIDPILAFLDTGVQVSSDHSVRRALAPLAALAERRNCVILLVRHLNKNRSAYYIYRGAGSIGFLAVCRSAWLVAPDPHDPDKRILAQLKNNLAPLQPSLAFRLSPLSSSQHSELSTQHSFSSPSTQHFVWLGQSSLTADQLLGASLGSLLHPDRPRTRARLLLQSFLQDGPRTSEDVAAFAAQNSIADRTLSRAKADLEIQSVRVRADGRFHTSYWLLPQQTLPDSIPTSSIDCDPAEILDSIPNP
jgi:hypothetical protein